MTDFSFEAISNVLRKYEEKNESRDLLIVGNLVFNWGTFEISYKGGKQIPIGKGSQVGSFLLLLMRRKDEFVSYDQIIKSIFKKKEREAKLPRDIQFVRVKLVTLFKDAGMEENVIKRILINRENLGYKLQTL